ncbi:10876_t:CDS:2, partial [Entrophospora sp. SA101]
MNKYREILGEEKKKNVSKSAEELIRSGPWDIDDSNDNEVELCYFPCILSKGKETEIYYKFQLHSEISEPIPEPLSKPETTNYKEDALESIPDEHLKIINECHNCISTPNNEDLRQSLLNKILPQTKLLNGWLPYLQQITDSQRTVLKTMAHQNIQARDLLAKYNELLANKNAESSNSDQKSSHEDEETLPQKVGKVNEQFECELEKINKQLLENKKLDAQIVKNELKNAEKKALTLEAALGDATNFKKNNDTFKDVLGFILQSIIIYKVFSAIENITYRNKNGNFNYFETAIMNYTNEIIEWTTKLSQTRPGNDHVTKMTPIKIRQQIYEALALRGFNNYNNKSINSIRDDIMNEMNKYREILDEGRKKTVSKHADELVRFGIKPWFCFEIQEPPVDIKWYGRGCIVDTNFMEGLCEMDDADSYR